MTCYVFLPQNVFISFFFFKGIILSTLNVPISLLVQIIIRVRELILLITPFNRAGKIIELSKEANKLSVKSNWSISLCHRIVGGSQKFKIFFCLCLSQISCWRNEYSQLSQGSVPCEPNAFDRDRWVDRHTDTHTQAISLEKNNIYII